MPCDVNLMFNNQNTRLSDFIASFVCLCVAVGSGNACWLCEQACQDVSGHQGVRGPQSGLQRDAQTQQAGTAR